MLALLGLLLSVTLAADPGRALFVRHCATCHGRSGDGAGPSAAWLSPRPRDFTSGVYKFRTTASGAVPTQSDIVRTVRVGVPGTAMPAWGRLLRSEQIDALARYLMTLSDWFDEPLYPEDILIDPDTLVVPARSPQREAAGAELYTKMGCDKCHGADGRGVGRDDLVDDWGDPIVAFDFTRGTYRGGSAPADIYRSFTTGLSGTPMPAFGDSLTEAQRWDLVFYVQSLARPRRGLLAWLASPPRWNQR